MGARHHNREVHRSIESLRLGVDPLGNALATWAVDDDVQAAMGSPQGLWQPPISLGGGAPAQLEGTIREADLALDAQGNAVVVWVDEPDILDDG